ncbi:MAG: sugar phosphate nucleotidyltransferase [Patescibacteria group bacterium]|nr:sugar phosphate nucleotidyltransferase [Patescibacteria group bacterium]
MNCAVILAGGHGTRLWPISRKNSPKQTECFFNNKTLLQITYERTKQIFSKNNIFISCGEKQYEIFKNQFKGLKRENFIIEPEARGTAMAIGFACVSILKKDKDAKIVMINSDHYISDINIYKNDIKSCLISIDKNPRFISLMGVNPTYPETAYGYIQVGNFFKNYNFKKFYKVAKFKEKPDLETAKRYLKNGKFLWNPAWFVFRADTMISLFKKYLPGHFCSLKNIEHNFSSRIIKQEFKKVENISIDYGIIEKVKDMIILPSKVNWRDIGAWNAVKDCFGKSNENLIDANVILIDSKDNLIINKDKSKIISLIGINDLVIVDTKDALFICPKDKSQEVKNIISILKKQSKYKKYL